MSKIWEIGYRALLAANVFLCIVNGMHGAVYSSAFSAAGAVFLYVCKDWGQR